MLALSRLSRLGSSGPCLGLRGVESVALTDGVDLEEDGVEVGEEVGDVDGEVSKY